MSSEVTYLDVTVTFNDQSVIGICIPTDMDAEHFIERAKRYNAGMVNVDMGSSRHRTLLMELLGLDKDALFRRAVFYAVTATDIQLIRSLPLTNFFSK